jgi:hypothetical protein
MRSIPPGVPVTVRRLIAIAFIFAACSIAWNLPGSSVALTTGELEARLSHEVTLHRGDHPVRPDANHRTAEQARRIRLTREDRATRSQA